MTADRRADRRLTRVHHASPYSQKTRNAKPSQHSKKSSGWSLAGFLRYFNPLRLGQSQEPEEGTEEDTSQDELDTNQSSQSSDDVFGPRTQPTQPPPPPAVRPPDPLANSPDSPSILQLPSLPEPSASPLKNVDAVKTYLEQNGSRPLNQVEIAGLVSMLQDSIDNIDDDTQQPFRFSKSPSRASSPATNSFLANTTTTPKTPTKTLSKNPNGTYKWQGAGSARRNRYHSPAFGSPSSGNKIKLQPAETAKSDSKRRRVGQDAETSSPQKTSASRQSSTEPATASTSTTSSTGTSDAKDATADQPPQTKPQLNGINTSRLNKGTAPVVSSPLRQAWGQDDFPSPNSSPTSAPKPSRAATFMTELIREATPPKKPDLANPYQTASPVKVVKPPTKKPARKPGAVPKQPPAEKEKKLPEMSMQAIIEATLPKGSKRSRPPAHLSASTNGSSETSSVNSPSQSPSPPPKQSPFPSFQNGSSASINGSKAATVEEVEDEDELPSPKKQKKAPTLAEPMIVEIEDPQPHSQPFLRPSEVVEPGDAPHLQTTGLNGVTSSPAPMISPTTTGRSFFSLKSSAPKEPSKLRFSIKADRDETTSSASSVSPTAAVSPKDAKAEVLSIAISELPDETFNLPWRTIREGRSSGELRAEKEVRGFVDHDIPVDDRWSLSSSPVGQSNIKKAGSSTNLTTLPTANGGFNWGAAGLKPPKQGDGWKCGTCDLMNPASAKEKCTVCNTSKPGVSSSDASAGSKNGFSTPTTPSGPFPFGSSSSTSSTSTTPSAFSFGGPRPAGPAFNFTGSGSTLPKTTTATTAMTSNGTGGGFNWSAAGLKPPSNNGGWTCGTCALMNPESAKEKCTVCDAPKL